MSFESVRIGTTASICRQWSESDVARFAELSGDFNPLHTDEVYARTTCFERRLVHGMLVGSLSSALVGMYLPGKNCVYVGQTLFFKGPVFIGDTVNATGTVISRSESARSLIVSIVMRRGDEVVVEGEARVRFI